MKIYPEKFKKIIALDKELRDEIWSLFLSALSQDLSTPKDKKILLFLCELAGLPVDKPLKDVLPEKTADCLRNMEVYTVGELSFFCGDDIPKIRNLGIKAQSDISTMFAAAMGHLGVDFSNKKRPYCSIILEKFRNEFLTDYAFYIQNLTENYQDDSTENSDIKVGVNVSELRQKAYNTVQKEIAEVEAAIMKASDEGKATAQIHDLPGGEKAEIIDSYFNRNGFNIGIGICCGKLDITWL